jgi:hypothetical protein
MAASPGFLQRHGRIQETLRSGFAGASGTHHLRQLRRNIPQRLRLRGQLLACGSALLGVGDAALGPLFHQADGLADVLDATALLRLAELIWPTSSFVLFSTAAIFSISPATLVTRS